MKILANQLRINDVLYYVGDRYSNYEEVKKIEVSLIELRKHNTYNTLIINNNYHLYQNVDGYFYKDNLFFSEKKANNVLKDYIEIKNKEKERYKQQDIKEQEYKDLIIKDKLEEKYINKPIMIYQENEWRKTTVKNIYATHRGIYLSPKKDGHVCKMSKEGKTWKWWSELEELETQKRLLEEKIKSLKKVEKRK